MNTKLKGILAGIFAAVCYGTNPLGAKFMLQDGLNNMSTVFYRYVFAVLILAVTLKFSGHSFKITKRELGITAFLGFFFSLSSLTLYASFSYMDAGLASTILFCYPVMVAVIMVLMFHEKLTFTTIASLVLAISGILLLSKGNNSSTLGVILVILSSLTYSVYIVSVNRMKLKLDNLQLTFWVSVFGLITIALASLFGSNNHLQPLPSIASTGWAFMLGLVPTVLSLIFMNIAIKEAGSTPAAIMGALEPVTAVMIGHFVFDEAFTIKLLIGIILILTAVMLIVLNNARAKNSPNEIEHSDNQPILAKQTVKTRRKK